MDKVVSLAQVRWRKTGSLLRRKLTDFAEEVMLEQEATRAQDIYFRQVEDDLWSLDEDFIIERCFEWFIFDYRLSEGPTPLQLFADINVEDLTLTEALLLVLWNEARCSYYEVTRVIPGKSLTLKDVFTGHTFVVREPGLQPEAEEGQILFVRLLRVASEYELSTSAIGIDASFKPVIQEWVRLDFDRWCKMNGRNDSQFDLYLQEEAHRISAQAIRFSLRDQAVNGPAREYPVSRLLTLLQGDVLKRVCRTREGREQVEALLDLIQGTDIAGAEHLAPERHSQETTMAGFSWPRKGYAGVAGQVEEGLIALGFARHDIQVALRIWYHFCVQEQPVLRKPGAWTAAVIYTLTKLGGGRQISQSELARRYEVAPSSVSSNFSSLSRALHIFPVKAPTATERAGRARVQPLLDKIIHSLRS